MQGNSVLNCPEDIRAHLESITDPDAPDDMVEAYAELERVWPILVEALRHPLTGRMPKFQGGREATVDLIFSGGMVDAVRRSIAVQPDWEPWSLEVASYRCGDHEHSVWLMINPEGGDEVTQWFAAQPAEDRSVRCRDQEGLQDALNKHANARMTASPWTAVRLARARNGGEVQWLLPGILERGKLAALFGPPKSGKSLYALEQACTLAKDGNVVTYFDEENDPADVYARALDMGYNLEELSDQLRYHSFTSLSVDTEEGAARILELSAGSDLVVFDSYAKFFSKGSQNADADVNRAYHLTLKPLKKQGVAVLRLDHSGHTETRRPSGSIQKLADVDHNWMIRAENAAGRSERTVTLTHTENRTGQGADTITLKRRLGPLRHDAVDLSGPAEIDGELTGDAAREAEVVHGIVERLDALSVPLDWPVSRCMDMLKQNGGGVKRARLVAAQRQRAAG